MPTALALVTARSSPGGCSPATPAGLAIVAAGDNPAGAFRSGVRVPLAQIGAYAIAGGAQRLRRLLHRGADRGGRSVDRRPADPQSITAAVLGGVGFLGGQGTMRGALTGSLLLGSSSS